MKFVMLSMPLLIIMGMMRIKIILISMMLTITMKKNYHNNNNDDEKKDHNNKDRTRTTASTTAIIIIKMIMIRRIIIIVILMIIMITIKRVYIHVFKSIVCYTSNDSVALMTPKQILHWYNTLEIGKGTHGAIFLQ